MKNPNNPLVAICIPTFNGAKYLKDALECVKMQTYENIEVIISDDASTDNTLEIVEVFKNEVSFPVYIFHHQPQGIGTNWNNCIRHANGELIKFLFQDDLLEPTCIAEMVEPFRNNKKLGLVFCRRKIIYDAGNTWHISWVKRCKDLHKFWKELKPTQKGKKLLKDPNLLNSPQNKVGEPTAVLLSKVVFKKVGYFDTDLRQTLDLEFWYRVFTKFDIGFIDRELASFRLHDGQTTFKNQFIKDVNDYLILPQKVFKSCFFYLDPKLQRELFYKHHKFGRFAEALKNKIKKMGIFKR